MTAVRYHFGTNTSHPRFAEKENLAENAARARALAAALDAYAALDRPLDADDWDALIVSSRNLFERVRRVAI